MPLTELSQPDFDVEIALAYATDDNVTGKAIYRRAVAQLHPQAAEALKRAGALAAAVGLRIKIFDAYRPVEAQWRLWQAFPDPEFVADPREGSNHSRGIAVDMTLVDAADGRELDMGTAFDDFRPIAHHGRCDIPVTAQKNRALLLGLMTAAGWDWNRYEWWHYQLFDSLRYPLLEDTAVPCPLMAADSA